MPPSNQLGLNRVKTFVEVFGRKLTVEEASELFYTLGRELRLEYSYELERFEPDTDGILPCDELLTMPVDDCDLGDHDSPRGGYHHVVDKR